MEKMLEVFRETSEPIRQIQATVEETQLSVEATQVTVKDIFKSLQGSPFSRYLITAISN